MSTMIMCDRCKKLMYADSRSNKGAYCSMNIQYTDGMTTLNLCRSCHKNFIIDFMELYNTQTEYDEDFGEGWDD